MTSVERLSELSNALYEISCDFDQPGIVEEVTAATEVALRRLLVCALRNEDVEDGPDGEQRPDQWMRVHTRIDEVFRSTGGASDERSDREPRIPDDDIGF